MLQLLARRAAESNAFSVPDNNALWSRAEDDLLVQAVAKHSTSDVLFRDWREVAWELPGRSEQQCKERYRLADTVVELTFIFLRVSFRAPLSYDPRTFSQKMQTRRILHELFTVVHVMRPHPPPLPPCPHPPRPRMHTGASVLATQPGTVCLTPRD